MQGLDIGVEFGTRAGQLDTKGGIGNVNDPGAEYIGQAFDLAALGIAFGLDLDEHHFSLDIFAFGDVLQFDHVHQLIELLGDLLDDAVGTHGDNRHAR